MNAFLLAHFLRSALICGLGLAVLVVLRNRSAATKHAAAAVTLLSLFALPFVQARVPTRAITYLPQVSAMVKPLGSPENLQAAAATPTPIQSLPLEVLVAYAYVLVAGLLLLRVVAGFLFVAYRVILSSRDSRPGTPLYTDKRAVVPMTAWCGRHVILLPEAWRTWSSERLNTVIEHERAHIRRGDWFVLIFSQIACAMYWANPLVWFLLKRVRSLSEQAADDAVLRAGIPATNYAQDLLDISKSLKRQPSLALHMADKAEVAKRIEMVLSSQKLRGSVSPGALVGVAVLISAAALAAASWTMSPGRLSGLIFNQQPVSPYKDIREGKTVAGQASNNFTGTLADGRKVRVLQVSRKVDGKVTAWTPDGSLLTAKDTIKHGYAKGSYLHFLVEMESTSDPDDINGGLGSGPYGADDPKGMTFAGGWVLPAASATTRRIISLIEPHDDALRSSFTFGVSDRGWTRLATFDPKAIKDNGGIIDFSLAAAKPPFPWEKWKEKKPVPGSAIKYTDTNGDMGDRRVVVTLVDGTQEIPSGSWSTEPNYPSAMKSLYFIQTPPAQVAAVAIEQRQSFAVELLGLALKPTP